MGNKKAEIILHQTNNLTLQKDIYGNIQQIMKIILGDQNLLLGGFNAKIGTGKQGISNKDPKITPNGKRLTNLKYKIAFFMD